MGSIGLTGLLIIVVLLLVAAALVKYVFFSRKQSINHRTEKF